MLDTQREHLPTTGVSYRLPPELIIEIIDACVATYRKEYGEADNDAIAKTLGAFSLTCHAFLPHCQSHLLCSVTLKTESALSRFIVCIQSSSRRNHDEIGIGKYVRELAFFEQSGTMTSWIHTAILRLGPKLPHLATLVFTNSAMEDLNESFFAGLIALPSTITHLRLNYVTFSTFDALSRVVLALPKLQRLTMVGYAFWSLMNIPPALPSIEHTSRDQVRQLDSLKNLEIAMQVPISFQYVVNWLSLIFHYGSSLEELCISSHRFDTREDIIAVNGLLKQCGNTLRELSMGFSQVDRKLLDTLDTSPLKNLSCFLLKGIASHIWQLVDIIAALKMLISNPSCCMTCSLTSVNLEIHLYTLNRLRRRRLGVAHTPLHTPSTESPSATTPSDRAVDQLSELDAALANSAFDKLENIAIRFPVGAGRITSGIYLGDTFPKLKAKADARANAGGLRSLDWLDVQVLSEDGTTWVQLQ